MTGAALICWGTRPTRFGNASGTPTADFTFWRDATDAARAAERTPCGPHCQGQHSVVTTDRRGRIRVLHTPKEVTMTSFPPTDNLPEPGATAILLIAERLSLLESAELAAWATALAHELLGEAAEPVALDRLHVAELDALHDVIALTAQACPDKAVIRWCCEMGRMIVAELDRREWEQRLTNAVAAAMDAELEAEKRRANSAARDTSGILPWSLASSAPNANEGDGE
jgi:hypothetical protein